MRYQNIEQTKITVKYIGETDFPYLTNGQIYDVLSVEKGWYRIETDYVGDYLFHPDGFEIVSTA